MHCIKCHRPMKHARPSGLGPVCEKRATPTPEVDRDLFGYDIDAACAAALARIGSHIESLYIEALFAVRANFRAARVAHGVWSK